VQKHISGDRVAGVNLHSIEWPASSSFSDSARVCANILRPVTIVPWRSGSIWVLPSTTLLWSSCMHMTRQYDWNQQGTVRISYAQFSGAHDFSAARENFTLRYGILTRRMAIANGTCVSFCNQPKANFGLPWVRPWDNRGKCYMDGKRIQCLSNASQHVHVYLQQFTSYSKILFENCNFFLPLAFNATVGVFPLEFLEKVWSSEN